MSKMRGWLITLRYPLLAPSEMTEEEVLERIREGGGRDLVLLEDEFVSIVPAILSAAASTPAPGLAATHVVVPVTRPATSPAAARPTRMGPIALGGGRIGTAQAELIAAPLKTRCAGCDVEFRYKDFAVVVEVRSDRNGWVDERNYHERCWPPLRPEPAERAIVATTTPPPKKIDELVCDQCGQRCATKVGLASHLRAHERRGGGGPR